MVRGDRHVISPTRFERLHSINHNSVFHLSSDGTFVVYLLLDGVGLIDWLGPPPLPFVRHALKHIYPPLALLPIPILSQKIRLWSAMS